MPVTSPSVTRLPSIRKATSTLPKRSPAAVSRSSCRSGPPATRSALTLPPAAEKRRFLATPTGIERITDVEALDLLRGAPFPLAGDHYKIEASGAAVETALKALASTLQLWEDNARLASSSAAGELAPLADRSFEDYDRAVARVAEPLAPDTVIAFELGYLDAHFVYPISSPKSVF